MFVFRNRNFYGNRDCQLLVKKYLENDINVSVYSVLACRIREGFILKVMKLFSCNSFLPHREVTKWILLLQRIFLLVITNWLLISSYRGQIIFISSIRCLASGQLLLRLLFLPIMLIISKVRVWYLLVCYCSRAESEQLLRIQRGGASRINSFLALPKYEIFHSS